MNVVKKMPLPEHEAKRLAALRRYGVLDNLPEIAFDELTRLAAQICGAPIALITLVDEGRQWFKSRVGLEVTETAREISFCTYTILQDDLMVVEDAAGDGRFADNPMVVSGPGDGFHPAVARFRQHHAEPQGARSGIERSASFQLHG